MNLLLVEDEERIADFLRRGMKGEGWSVTHASDAETGLELLRQGSFDVVILDVMLPGMSGIEMCHRMRARRDSTPVLMLTALGDVEHRIEGLRRGADDYLPKPFDFDELLARLEALHRRASGSGEASSSSSSQLTCGAMVFHLDARQVTIGCDAVDLTKRERDVLLFFMRNPNRLISRERLLNSVWGITEDPLTNVVDVHVARLRKKLGSSGEALRTIRGEGYILDSP